jgi:hypothetical protein
MYYAIRQVIEKLIAMARRIFAIFTWETSPLISGYRHKTNASDITNIHNAFLTFNLWT